MDVIAHVVISSSLAIKSFVAGMFYSPYRGRYTGVRVLVGHQQRILELSLDLMRRLSFLLMKPSV